MSNRIPVARALQWQPFVKGPACAVLLAAAMASGSAQAHALPACAADPFAPQAPADRDASLARPCGGEHLKWQVEPQDPAAAARRTGVLRARLDSIASERLAPGLMGTIKMSWAALGGEPATGLRTERTLVAAGGLMRIGDEWALNLDAGRHLAVASLPASTRAAMGGSWRPLGTRAGAGVVFAEWIGDDRGPEAHRVGARWWLLPKRLSLDVDARRELGPIEQRRYGVMLQLQP